MQLKLVYFDDYEFSPKDKPDKKYRIYVFLDPKTLQFFKGTDLNGTFEKFKIYDCTMDYKSGKLKVVSVS